MFLLLSPVASEPDMHPILQRALVISQITACTAQPPVIQQWKQMQPWVACPASFVESPAQCRLYISHRNGDADFDPLDPPLPFACRLPTSLPEGHHWVLL